MAESHPHHRIVEYGKGWCCACDQPWPCQPFKDAQRAADARAEEHRDG